VPTGGIFGAGLAGKNKGAGPCRGLGCRVSGQGRGFVKSRFSADVNVSNVHKTATNALSD
jgi:hypothetical protein